jgi:putative ABC transport system permease protein
LDQHEPRYFFATGLVKRNVSRQTAAADIQVIAKQLITAPARDYPEHFQMTARPMNEVIVDDFKQTLFLLIAAIILLLLISSSNVASLLLTHHSACSREIALRSALGASCGCLIRQLFVEWPASRTSTFSCAPVRVGGKQARLFRAIIASHL